MDVAQKTEQEPVQSDVSQAIPLVKQLDSLSRRELVTLADEKYGVNIDSKLDVEAIKKAILNIDQGIRQEARRETEESASKASSEDDPLILVVFYNMQSSEEDITFAFPGPRGMYGPEFVGADGKKHGNPKGHKKCPVYHLFPGMEISLPWSVVEHLRSRTFTRNRPVWDEATGQIKANIPIITPRFVLEQRLTKEQAVQLQKIKK